MARLKPRLEQQAPAAGAADMVPTSTGLLQEQEEGTKQTLTDEIRAFIVQGLARYEPPSRVAEEVKAHFNFDISRQHVYAYDPKGSQRIAPRWRELHAATREAYLREVAEAGIARKTVRLAMLDRMAQRSLSDHQFTRTAAFLEQAAKECGGLYENRKPVAPQIPASPATGRLDALPSP